MPHDAIENISQRYISRLTTDSALAQNDVKNAVAQLDISSKALAIATEWKGVIEPYWVNVKKSNNAYLEVEGFLNQLENLAKTVTKNGGIVAESGATDQQCDDGGQAGGWGVGKAPFSGAAVWSFWGGGTDFDCSGAVCGFAICVCFV